MNLDPGKVAAIDHMEDDVLSLGSQQVERMGVKGPLTQAKVNILLKYVVVMFACQFVNKHHIGHCCCICVIKHNLEAA